MSIMVPAIVKLLRNTPALAVCMELFHHNNGRENGNWILPLSLRALEVLLVV